MYNNPMIMKLPYSHKPIQEEKFIFPITGLSVGINKKISVGNIEFVDNQYLFNNIIDNELKLNKVFTKSFEGVKTFAIVDLRKYGNCLGLCKEGNNSLALQVLKQTIGAIYISIYLYRNNTDFERRIVISNKNIHEVDEGLNPYLACYKNKYMVIPNNVSEMLNASIFDFDLNNISNIIELLNKNMKQKNEYEKRICKSLELIYSIYNESYSRERILKWSILLNYIFRESVNQNLDSNDIGRKLKLIFNIVEEKKILEKMDKYISPKEKNTKKISKIMKDIYSRVRNNLMHGKLDFYTEYAVCNLEDIITLKIIVLEVIVFMTNDNNINKFKDIKEFNEFIEKTGKDFEEEMKKKKTFNNNENNE
ncbi:hypothetical protein QYB63_001224 [Clostridium perfringens]|nr:hypothetical protein [Clostridium perfringens]